MNHRFAIDSDVELSEQVTLTGDEAHHAIRVSRVRKGEHVELIGNGAGFEAEVVDLDKETVTLRVLAELPSRESPLSLTLAPALIKLDLFELVLRKGTEIGVTRFLPLVTDHVEIQAARISSRRGRWDKIIREAVKQSGRIVEPEILEPVSFSDVIESGGLVVVLDAEGSAGEVTGGAVTVCVGPEGGWSERERQLATDSGAFRLNLGPRRLRAETAAIAGAAWAQMSLGDWR